MSTYRVDRSEALRYMGYKGQETNQDLNERIDQLISRCEETAQPRFTYRIFDLRVGADAVEVADTSLVLESTDIVAHLHGAKRLALMACTLGMGNERESRRLSRSAGSDSVIFDAASSSLVEVVADACNAQIVAEAKKLGLYTNWRYGPGYGDLSLDVQPLLLRVLNAEKVLGLTCTDAKLLLPTKSITAIVGLFDTPQDNKMSCSNCNFQKYCELRKTGSPCYQ